MATTKKSKVLVVEDCNDIQGLLQEILVGAAYIVDVASNGREAINLLRAADEVPCLILLDIMMPDMDGYQFREEQEKDVSLPEFQWLR